MCTSGCWIQNECTIHWTSCGRTSRLRVTAQVSRLLFVCARRPPSRPSGGWKPRRGPTGFQPTACFIDLIPHPHARPLPPLPPKLDLSAVKVPSSRLFKQVDESEESVLLAAWKRFGPNNFVLHSFAALNDGVARGSGIRTWSFPTRQSPF
jgi:hypothetical protein